MHEVVIGSGFEKKEQSGNQAVVKEEGNLDNLRKKYKENGEVIYEVTSVITEDDETEREVVYLFQKPTTASYDRYVKTASASSSRALKTFIQDNIVEEQESDLKYMLDEYPAFAIGVGEKLLNMLGLSKSTTVKKL